jgi:hypothetical protein
MSGKGSNRRPQQVSEEQLKSSWEAIFGKKEPKPENKERKENDATDTPRHS